MSATPQSSLSENPAADLASLSRALVVLTRQLNRPCEESEATRLLSEVMQSHRGTAQGSWWNWLLSAGRSLGLSLRVSDVPPRDLSALLKAGMCVLMERRAAAAHGLNLSRLEAWHIIWVDLLSPDSRHPEPSRESVPTGSEPLIRVIIASLDSERGDMPHHHEPPWRMLWRLVAPDQKDMWTVATLSGVAGLLMLSVPATAQQLVRTVTFASLYQPIVVLSLMLLGLLGFVAALQGLQVYVAEIIQRRLFVRIAAQVTQRLARAEASAWKEHAMPEVVNRFLEVAIVQKVTAALLVDGVAILLTTLISMSVMAFYHPFLLGYDILLLVLLATIFFGFGRNGVKTAIQESRAKYGVLSWLEDMARCPGLFRTGGVELLPMQRTDVLCADYLRARSAHFSILIRQIVLVLMLQVIATTALLGLGGFLVLNEQLTLGQLVAAELIVAMIVASFAKLGKHLEGWYDLLASVDKLSHLFDLPPEPHVGLVGLSRQGPAELVVSGVAGPGETGSGEAGLTTGGATREESLRLSPGEMVAVVGWSPSVTRDLAESLRGLQGVSGLHSLLDGVQVEDIRPDVLRQHIAVASDMEFLPGTIAENIHLSRQEVSEADVREACEAVGLTEELRRGGIGLSTPLLPSGWPLLASQQRRLILARALAGKPRVLFVDHLCDLFTEAEFAEIRQRLLRYQPQTTILLATARQELAQWVNQAQAGALPR